MFGRPPRHDATPPSPPAVPFERPPTPQQLAAARLVIGPNIKFVGTDLAIITDGTVQIDGEFNGDIHAREVVVGDGGAVHGAICGEDIRVHGRVTGTLRGTTISLQPSSITVAKIFHDTLTINTGARFEGMVRRADNPLAVTPKWDDDAVVDLANVKAEVQRPKLEIVEPIGAL